MSTADLREKILFRIGKAEAAKKNMEWVAKITYEDYIESLKSIDGNDKVMHDLTIQAMDEYFTERSMELLEYMAKNEIRCFTDNADEEAKVPMFYDVKKSQYLTAQELFQNFL